MKYSPLFFKKRGSRMAVLKVRAVAEGDVKWVGFYNLKRRVKGEEFVLDRESDFSHRWMEAIGWKPADISQSRKESFKEIIRQAPSAIDVRKDIENKKKTAQKVTVAEPVPATVAEVNTEDKSPNAPEEAI
jgi:hypothetical protein